LPPYNPAIVLAQKFFLQLHGCDFVMEIIPWSSST